MTTITYASLTEVPEGLRDAAKEDADTGKVIVKVAPLDRITEFRDKNIALSKERDDLVAKVSRYEGVTGVHLEEVEKLDDFARMLEGLRDTKKKVDDGALVENTSLEEAAQARITEITNTFKSQLADSAKERDAYKSKLSRAEESLNHVRIENAIRAVAADPEVGMLDGAVRMVLTDAYGTFKIEDGGKIVPKAPDGTIIYGSDGVSPMSVKEWLLKVRETNEFLFKGSKGGGAAGGDNKNPGRLSAVELDRMTPQQRLNYARKHGLV